jgi:CRP-like cAMP-binding protein
MDILRFASLPQLAPLSNEQLAQVAPHASERIIPAGRRLLLDGPFAQELVFIAGGRGVVRCAGEPVAELGPGHAFGELAPDRQAYETATITAVTELRLVVVSGRGIRMLREVAPATVAALVAACTFGPAARAGTEPAAKPAASHLSLVRSAA